MAVNIVQCLLVQRCDVRLDNITITGTRCLLSNPITCLMSDESKNTTGGGRSLGGGAAEPLPSSWSRPSERPRVGRIGDWSGSSSSGYFVLS